MTDTHIKRLQNVQHNFLRSVLVVPISGTPKEMVELDRQISQIHLRIKQRKLRPIGKVMAKKDDNLCKFI